MKKTLLLLVLVMITGLQAVMAQATKTLKGVVLDEKNAPLDGAQVSAKGGDGATFTDANGNFELTVPQSVTTLLVEFFGNEKEVAAGDGSAPLSISINTSVQIEGVIKDAYRTVTKENFTGAASQITSEQLEKFPVNSFTKAIEGAAPGVQTTNGGGQPGGSASFRIRGTSSISASSAPLIVLDGAAYDGSYSSINPNDIESVTILKDASATSLYGSRGAGGVIVVTTKRGKQGEKPRVNIDAKYGLVTRFMPDYKVMKSERDYYETMWDAYRNRLIFSTDPTLGGYDTVYAGELAAGLDPGTEPGIITLLGDGYNSYKVDDDQLIDPMTGKLIPGEDKLKYHDDWEKELSRVGKRNEYNLSVSNANEKTDYYFSAGYLKEQGFIKYSDYERFTARLNVNTQATTWLRAGMNISGALSKQNYFGSVGTTAGGYNPFFASRTNAPIYPVYYRDEDGNKEIDPMTGEYKYDWGSIETDPESSIGTRQSLPQSNVLGSLAMDKDENRISNFNTNTYLEAKFLKDFTLRTNLSATYYDIYSTSYNNPFHGQYAENNGYVGKSSTSGLSYTWNQLLTWSRKFDNHNFTILAGHENYDLTSRAISASRYGVVIPGNAELAGMPTPNGATSQSDVDRMESYLANLNYDYNNRYFVSASIRRDGTSRFYNKWGNFWSIGGGWIISQEEFLRDINNLNTLKIKASYGTQGNKDISTLYGWQSLYTVDYPNGANAGVVLSQLENQDLTWEAQKQFNVGVEFRIFDRVSGEFDYFNKTNADLLYQRPMPLSSGVAYRWENTMTQSTNGLELTLNVDVIKPKVTNGFSWDINANFTHIKDKITKMPEGLDTLYSGYGMWSVGHSQYEYYLVKSAGVDPNNGDELFYYTDSSGNKEAKTNVYSEAQLTGRTYVGTSVPKLMGALTNNFSYKGFDLTFLVTYAIGGKYYDQIYQGLMGNQLSPGQNMHVDMLNRWTIENPNAELPRVELTNGNIANTSDRFLIDGSYLNIRNINIGYSFNDRLVTKMKLSSLRLYMALDNVYLFSKPLGMDPQASFNGAPGYSYSPSRTINFGINVGL